MFYKNSLILFYAPVFTHDGYGNWIINLFLLINNLKINLLFLEFLHIFKYIYILNLIEFLL